jgi:hypothetical protein
MFGYSQLHRRFERVGQTSFDTWDAHGPCGVGFSTFRGLIICHEHRAEPRDLVDVMFLERAGHLPEDDFELALAKDAGMDPSTLAWLIRELPVQPMPVMIQELSESELVQYRDNLAERFKQFTIGD